MQAHMTRADIKVVLVVRLMSPRVISEDSFSDYLITKLTVDAEVTGGSQ